MSGLVEISNQEFVLVEEQVPSTIEIVSEGTLVATEEVLTIVSEAVQGPPGIQGVKGDRGEKGEKGDPAVAALEIDPTLVFENALL